MNPPRGHRHAHRDPEQVLAQRRWVAPAQHGGYREVLEPVLHHAIEGMGHCAQPEPECVDVPEAAGASVQEPVVLLLLDPVLGRAPVAVHRFVDRLRVGLLERGDDEATVVSGFTDRRTWAFRDGLRSAVGRFPVLRCRPVVPAAIRPWRSRGVRGSSCRACDSRSSGSRGPLAVHSPDPTSTGPADRPSTAGPGLSADHCTAAPARHPRPAPRTTSSTHRGSRPRRRGGCV